MGFNLGFKGLSSSTCFERHPLIFRRSMMLVLHVQLTSLTSWRWADDARNM